MTAGRQRHHAATGFTLLELLVVLSILALLAAIAVPALVAPSDGVRLRAAGSEIAATLRLARSVAIARNREVAVAIDAEKRFIESTGSTAQHFAPDIFVELTIAEGERTSPSRGGFRFFPDGSSTGGSILLRLRGRELRLCVDWMTGRAGQGAEC
jgi:general secretion pathway protein H